MFREVVFPGQVANEDIQWYIFDLDFSQITQREMVQMGHCPSSASQLQHAMLTRTSSQLRLLGKVYSHLHMQKKARNKPKII